MITADVEVLRSLCREWQERLGLLHWDVKLFIVRHYDFPPNRMGNCYWTMSILTATIRILHPQDYDPAVDEDADMEQILVHELLHLHFAPYDRTSSADKNEIASEGIAQEQTIELLSKALVSLKRGVAHGSIPGV